VLNQAGGLCAYCCSAEALLGVTFEIDHIVPLSAGGGTTADNLCLSCPTCNRQKGVRQTALDPASGAETPLFHPLTQTWGDHFTWSDDGATVIGLTPAGHATIALLRMNRPVLVQMRRYWVALGLHPPR
jgi:hypothetical protein